MVWYSSRSNDARPAVVEHVKKSLNNARRLDNGIGVLPARPRRPKDKPKVEAGVRFAQTCILGRLRNQTFFSLEEANAAIRKAVERINTHVMKRLGQTRQEMFETMERPALAALPVEDYEYAEWKLARARKAESQP